MRLSGVWMMAGALMSVGPAIGSAEPAQETPPLEEIVVVASKIPQPLWRVASQVTTLHGDEFRYQQVTSLNDVARYQPALEAEHRGSRFGDNGLAIRGIGGNRVAMEFDGVPMPRGFSIGEFANNARSALDPAVIERMEILRGPASSMYGSDALGGVVAITSVDPSMLVTAGDAGYVGAGTGYYGADSSAFGYGTLAGKRGAHAGLLSLNHRTGSEVDANGLTGPQDRIDFDQDQLFGKYSLRRGDARFAAVVDHYERDTTSDLQTVLGFGRQFGSTIDLEGDDVQERTRLSLHYETAIEGVVDVASLMVFHQETRTRQDTRDRRADDSGTPVQLIERRFELDEETRGVEGKLSHQFSTGIAHHVIVAGFEWEREELAELRDGLSTDLQTGAQTNVLPPGETLPTRDLPRSEVDEFGLYVQDEIEWGAITLIPALRWDRFELDASLDDLIDDPARITDLDSDNVTARLGAVGRLGDSASWYAHYAEGFRAPPAADVNLFLDYRGFVTVRALPNPDLVPEESENLEAGLRYDGNGLFAEIGVYRSTFDNFIESRVMVGVDPTDGALLFQSRNIDAATIEGVEARLQQQLGTLADSLADWSLEVGFHRARGERDDTGAPINSVGPAKTVFGLHWRDAAPVSTSLMVRHFDKQSRTDFSDGAFFVPPAATVVDLIGRWEFSAWGSIHAGIYNLADERYWRYGDVRILDENDPRSRALARPGRNVGVTIHLNTP